MRAKKSLGQHFLTGAKALSQILDAGDIHADDVVLEIGPGRGVLTEGLLGLAGKVITVEKDRDLVPYLEERFTEAVSQHRLEIVQEDILLFDPQVLSRHKGFTYKIVANIPYYITGAILKKFLSASVQPTSMTLLVQKEVAERIIARDKKESILSLSVKAYGTPRIIARVPAGAFTPPPSVDSAILHIDAISRNFFIDIDEEYFFDVVTSVFGSKRKQLGGTLGRFLGSKERATEVLSTLNIKPTTRPEDLALSDWKEIVRTIKKTF